MGRQWTSAQPGRRVAVNLRGVKKEQLGRGDALATPDALRPTRFLDVQLRLLPDAKSLRRGQTVRLHFGTMDALARVHPLDGETLTPGETALAQLRLADELFVPVHERFVIRAVSPAATLGGGVIVDAAPQRHRRADADSLRRVQTLSGDDATGKVREKLMEAREAGQEINRLAVDLALAPEQVSAALAELNAVRVGGLALHRDIFDALCLKALEAVHQFHAAHPTQRGMPREDLRRRLPLVLPLPLFGCVLDETVRQRHLEAEDGLVREVGFSSEALLSPVERAIASEIEAAFLRGGLKPPSLKDVVGTTGGARILYHYLRESGKLVETPGPHQQRPRDVSQCRHRRGRAAAGTGSVRRRGRDGLRTEPAPRPHAQVRHPAAGILRRARRDEAGGGLAGVECCHCSGFAGVGAQHAAPLHKAG